MTQCKVCRQEFLAGKRGRLCPECKRQDERNRVEKRREAGIAKARALGLDRYRYCSKCRKVKDLVPDFGRKLAKSGNAFEYDKLCKKCKLLDTAKWGANGYLRREKQQEKRTFDKTPDSAEDDNNGENSLSNADDDNNGQVSISNADDNNGQDSVSNTDDIDARARPVTEEHRRIPSLRDILWARSGRHVERIAQEMAEIVTRRFNKYDSCIAGYKEFLRHYNHEESSGEQFIARVATFHPHYLGKEKSDTPVGDFQILEREDTGGCKILYTTLEDLIAAIAGRGLPDVSYVLVPDNHPAQCALQTRELLRKLRQVYNGCEVEYQNYVRGNDSAPLTKHMRMADFSKRIDDLQISPAKHRPYADGRPPLNALNIAGDKLTSSFQESPVVSAMELTLLRDLTDSLRLRTGVDSGIGKRTTHQPLLVDGDSCAQFHLLGFPGTISRWHMDVVGATWIKVVSGDKAWCIYDGPEDDATWEQFSDQTHGGVRWQPPEGTVKTIPLADGDTLVMMPGKFTPHMPVSCGDEPAHITGGQVWPARPEYLLRFLDAQRYLIKHNWVVSNENVPRQFPDLFDELETHIRKVLRQRRTQSNLHSLHQPDYEAIHLAHVRSFIDDVRSMLSCSCPKADCDTTTVQKEPQGNEELVFVCPCRNGEGVSNAGGCTAWCHGGRFLSQGTRDCLNQANDSVQKSNNATTRKSGMGKIGNQKKSLKQHSKGKAKERQGKSNRRLSNHATA